MDLQGKMIFIYYFLIIHLYFKYTFNRSVPISPFTRRNEKIRDSLSSLTKSLQLPTINDETKASDSLENRLQRLKSLQNMSNLDI